LVFRAASSTLYACADSVMTDALLPMPEYCMLPIVRAVALLLAPVLPMIASAQGVTESNYQHVDPAHAIRAEGPYMARSNGDGSFRLRDLVIAGNVGLDARGLLVPTLPEPPEGHSTLAVLFDEDVCVVAAVVILDLGGVRNSVEVAFDFIDRDGNLIEREIRFPAGTTRQAFSADGFASRFAALRLTAPERGALGISRLRALPCSLGLS
jgi:hypothetical protein